jgi:hypothetical protein
LVVSAVAGAGTGSGVVGAVCASEVITGVLWVDSVGVCPGHSAMAAVDDSSNASAATETTGLVMATS